MAGEEVEGGEADSEGGGFRGAGAEDGTTVAGIEVKTRKTCNRQRTKEGLGQSVQRDDEGAKARDGFEGKKEKRVKKKTAENHFLVLKNTISRRSRLVLRLPAESFHRFLFPLRSSNCDRCVLLLACSAARCGSLPPLQSPSIFSMPPGATSK